MRCHSDLHAIYFDVVGVSLFTVLARTATSVHKQHPKRHEGPRGLVVSPACVKRGGRRCGTCRSNQPRVQMLPAAFPTPSSLPLQPTSPYETLPSRPPLAPLTGQHQAREPTETLRATHLISHSFCFFIIASIPIFHIQLSKHN